MPGADTGHGVPPSTTVHAKHQRPAWVLHHGKGNSHRSVARRFVIAGNHREHRRERANQLGGRARKEDQDAQVSDGTPVHDQHGLVGRVLAVDDDPQSGAIALWCRR